ncbi:hypothetical protein DFA_11301 [Cavenderia fasciculata]|uniref:Uncharacterized protein n=1 Tax=Cavenderia fasciculata TaxID=261658 RepID=F4QC53_CACFS|nr:uncharacterized protein DFA_11301 [Cavenderia fasciculata]EGG13540.1 hypothetical protein DFA_11301 [Cavenderia fasciculata]|eukprot:XP_004350244.1 hypothetical protein DFA_11301 [Cavenderia fasciculata]
MEERLTLSRVNKNYQIGTLCPLCKEDFSKDVYKLNNHMILCFLYLTVDMGCLDVVKDTIKDIELDEQQFKKRNRETYDNDHESSTTSPITSSPSSSITTSLNDSCIDNDKEEEDNDYHKDNNKTTTRKRKKIENGHGSSYSTTPTTTTPTLSSSSNHYFKDLLFRALLIPILHREDYNESVMNLLMTCKDAMKWKDTVVFPRLPSIDTIESYKNNGRINQLPRRYNRVYIKSDRDLDYFKKNVDGLINHHCQKLNYEITDPIPAGLIPDHFTKIRAKGTIVVGSIPPFTTHLLLIATTAHQEVYKELFPDTLEVLHLHNGVIGEHSNIDDLLPHNLRILDVTSNLVYPYLFKLKNLHSLALRKIQQVADPAGHIDIRVGSIPNTIAHLFIHGSCVESGYILPSSVTFLALDITKNSFRCIPPSVKFLYAICREPTTLLEGSIPSSVTTLHLNGKFGLRSGSIPQSVNTLALIGLEVSPPMHTIPDSISTLSVNGLKCEFDGSQYPNNIKYFSIYGVFNLNKLKSTIPPSTKYFDFQATHTDTISIVKLNANDIPNGVTHIRLVPGFIPDNCEYLELPCNYDRAPLWWAVPKQLKTVICNPLCSRISQSIPSIKQLPQNYPHQGGIDYSPIAFTNMTYAKHWKMEIVNGPSYSTTTTTTTTTMTLSSLSSNHYFKDSLFRISMISILHREDDNQSVMNLLMTCKDAMKWKDIVVFPRLPSINTIESYKNNGRINQLPRRYNRVYIKSDRDKDYFKKNVDGLINHHCQKLNYEITDPIPAGLIPDHFTKIRAKGQIQDGSIPPFTTHLYLETTNQQEIYKELFPDTLEVLTITNGVIGERSNIDDLLPHNLRVLDVTSNCVHPYLFNLKKLYYLILRRKVPQAVNPVIHIDIRAGSIPNTIERMYLGNCVIERGYVLPSRIKLLVIDLSLNSPQCIPASVQYLLAKCNQPTTLLEGYIPSSVTTLHLAGKFEFRSGSIPRSVNTLVLIGLEVSPPIYTIQDSISSLYISGLKCDFDGSQYSNSIKHFSICGATNFNKLKSTIPPSTKYFDFQATHTDNTSTIVKLNANDIPNGVTHIRLDFKIFIFSSYHDLGNGFNQALVPGLIPDSCEYLEFPYYYDKTPLWWAVPKQLKTLSAMEERLTLSRVNKNYQIGTLCPLCKEDFSKDVYKLNNHMILCFLYLTVDMGCLDVVKDTIKDIELDEQQFKKRNRALNDNDRHLHQSCSTTPINNQSSSSPSTSSITSSATTPNDSCFDRYNDIEEEDNDDHQDNNNKKITTRKRKKIENGSSYSTTTTTKTLSSSNHYFKDSLFRVSMISILYREDYNESVMNLLMTCKDAMKWKDTVVFPRLPSINTIELYKNDGRFNQLPRRYNRVYIKNERDLDYFKKNTNGLINHHCKELNYLIDDVVPAGLIPDHFTKIRVDGLIEVGSIPPYTTHLYLGDIEEQEIYKELFPNTLEELKIPNGLVGEHSNPDDLLPHNIRVLAIKSNLVHPYLFKLKNLNYLLIDEINGDDDDQQQNQYHIDIHIGSIPNTIEYLYLENCIIEPGYSLPSSVKYLSIDLSKNSPQCIPSSVKYLYANCDQRRRLLPLLAGSIPSSVTDLYLQDVTLFPYSIEYFTIYGDFKSQLKSTIPPSTKYFDYQAITLNKGTFSANDIPNGVTHIRFGYEFSEILVPGFIPDSCEYLELHYAYDIAPRWWGVPKHLKTVSCNPFCFHMSQNIPPSKQTPKNENHQGGSGCDNDTRYKDFWFIHIDLTVVVFFNSSSNMFVNILKLRSMEERLNLSRVYKNYQIGTLCPLCKEDFSKDVYKLNNHMILCFLYLTVDMACLEIVKDTIKDIELDEQRKGGDSKLNENDGHLQSLPSTSRNNQSSIASMNYSCDDQDNNNSTTRKRKKIENGSLAKMKTTTSTNHYFKNSLFRVSMISILHREERNQSVMNLLMTCKDAMKWKDTVVFPRLPSINTIESYKNDGRFNQLPRRYNRVDIKSDRDLEYFLENTNGLINQHCKELNYLIDEPIPAGLIPDHFTKIRVNGQIEDGSIPPYTTHLVLGAKEEQEIYRQLFPNTLEELYITNGVIRDYSNVDDLLPHNIRILAIKSNLVHPYLFKLKKLNCLTIDAVEQETDYDDEDDDQDHIDIHIGTIPNTIEYLYLEDCIIEPGYTLPSSVKYLSIELDKNSYQCIPASVQYLYAICKEPTTILARSIPSSVIDLCLDGKFGLLPGSIPSSVKTLGLFDLETTPAVYTIPDSITTMYIGYLKCKLDVTLFPNSIKYFAIHGKYNFPLKSCIPPSTKYFDYQAKHQSKLNANQIPNGVTHIRLGNGLVKKALSPGFIPDSCEYLDLNCDYDKAPRWWAVPKQLKTVICNPFCSRISQSIPPSIKQLPANERHVRAEDWDANHRYQNFWEKEIWFCY